MRLLMRLSAYKVGMTKGITRPRVISLIKKSDPYLTPQGLKATVPVRSRLAGPQNDNKDWFDFGGKTQK